MYILQLYMLYWFTMYFCRNVHRNPMIWWVSSHIHSAVVTRWFHDCSSNVQYLCSVGFPAMVTRGYKKTVKNARSADGNTSEERQRMAVASGCWGQWRFPGGTGRQGCHGSNNDSQECQVHNRNLSSLMYWVALWGDIQYHPVKLLRLAVF